MKFLINRHVTTDLESHVRQLELYNRLRISVKIVVTWLQSALLPYLFCVGSSVVFMVYLVLRNQSLPRVVGLIMTYTAVVILVSIFIVSLDVMAIIQASEGVVQNLLSPQHGYYRDADPIVKAGLLKAARALRPIELPIGHFAKFDLGVTQVMYEEMLNQLLFLLAL